MVYCANCENEATHKTPSGTPLCYTCKTAYEWGQAQEVPGVSPIEDTDETCPVCGKILIRGQCSNECG